MSGESFLFFVFCFVFCFVLFFVFFCFFFVIERNGDYNNKTITNNKQTTEILARRSQR